jgi:hypothetical protein
VADAVGENYVIASRIEQLSFAKKFSGKFRAQEIAAMAGCAVENQDGVADDSFFVTERCSERAVVDSQFRQDFARSEMKIMDDVIGFAGLRVVGGE